MGPFCRQALYFSTSKPEANTNITPVVVLNELSTDEIMKLMTKSTHAINKVALSKVIFLMTSTYLNGIHLESVKTVTNEHGWFVDMTRPPKDGQFEENAVNARFTCVVDFKPVKSTVTPTIRWDQNNVT